METTDIDNLTNEDINSIRMEPEADERDEQFSSIAGSVIIPTNRSQTSISQASNTSNTYRRKFNGLTNPFIDINNPFGYMLNDNSSERPKKKQKQSEEDKDDDRVPIALEKYNELEIENMNNITTNDEGDNYDSSCWGCRNCALSKTTINSNIKGYRLLASYINENLFKIAVKELEIGIKAIYEEHLKYPVAKSLGEEPEEWSLQAIRKHFKGHVCDPAINMRYKLHAFQTVFDICETNVLRQSRSDPKDVDVDEKKLKNMAFTQDVINRLYTTRLENSVAFNLDVTPISEVTKASKFGHLNKSIMN